MESLSATDLYTVLDVARELGAMRTVDDLRAGVLPHLRRLVACDTASFNEIAPEAREAVITAVDPADILFDGAEEIFGAYAHQNPLIAAARGPGRARVAKFSDFINARELHELDIYDLVYRHIEVEHQIAFTLPAPSARVIGFALNRSRRHGDFTERDRRVLEAVRPFVIQAYENATARAHARATLAALQSTGDRPVRAVLVLDASGRIAFATDLASHWLGELPSSGMRAHLPEPLASWSARQRRRARDGVSHDGEQLDLPTRDAALTARFIPGEDDHPDAILLRRHARVRSDAVGTLGLTRRETQVLGLLADGLSNTQIAHELALSGRTVAKHLEHIYDKLDVGSRTAAVARARETSSSAASD
jgi:DNA-binding CsgD family transcriptional regulator